MEEEPVPDDAVVEGASDEAATANEERQYEERERRERERQKYESQIFASAEPLLRALFEEYPDASAGKELSRLERQMNNYTAASLAYGEVQFDSFHRIFTRLNRLGFSDEFEGKFVDIGSGVGKVVFSAGLFHDFSKLVGIEILSGLHQASLEVLESWKLLRRELPQRKRDMEVSLLLGDALTISWASETDVAFINATCFTREMLLPIGREACRLRPGAFVVITTHKLDKTVDPMLDKYRDLVLSDSMEVSFGGAVCVSFYRRTKKAALGSIEDVEKYVEELIGVGAS